MEERGRKENVHTVEKLETNIVVVDIPAPKVEHEVTLNVYAETLEEVPVDSEVAIGR